MLSPERYLVKSFLRSTVQSNPESSSCRNGFLKLLQSLLVFSFMALSACTFRTEKGSAEDPIQISVVPTKDARTLLLSTSEFSKWMEKETGLKFNVTIPTSYIAVVEALGSKKVDIAYLNTTNYLIANEKYGAEVKFISMNHLG